MAESEVTDPPLSPRDSPAIAALPDDGGLVVFGGLDTPRATEAVTPLMDGAWFNPNSGTWVPVPSPPGALPLASPTLVATSSNEVVLIGTECQLGSESAEGDIRCDPAHFWAGVFDLQSMVWRELPTPPDAGEVPGDGSFQFAGAVAATGGRVVARLGSPAAPASLWSIDPRGGEWVPVAPSPLVGAVTCGSPEGVVAVAMAGATQDEILNQPDPLVGQTTPPVDKTGEARPQAVTLQVDGSWSAVVDGAVEPKPQAATTYCTGMDPVVSSTAIYEFDTRDRRWISRVSVDDLPGSPLEVHAMGDAALLINTVSRETAEPVSVVIDADGKVRLLEAAVNCNSVVTVGDADLCIGLRPLSIEPVAA